MAEINIEKIAQAVAEKALQELRDSSVFVGRWIPVSERLPEDRREVLVTAYLHETYQVMMASYYGDGLWWCVPFNNCGEHMQRLKPKAWMPLPKPYKAESGGYGMSEVKIGQVIVDRYGISKVVKLDGWGGYTTEQIIPKEVFIEAYNKYIKAESEEGKWF